jgi:hypothetical protein
MIINIKNNLRVKMSNIKKNENELNPSSILNLLVKKSKEFEENIGLLNICNFVDSYLKPNQNLSFIDEYRKIIRTNHWNYGDDVETDYKDFLQRWQTTHLFYIDSAVIFFNYFINETHYNFNEIHRLAIISETFRGREGKRSKIGLDNIFENYISLLSNIIGEVTNYSETDDVIGLLVSSLGEQYFSAEYELFLDFYNFSNLCDDFLNKENILRLDERTEGLCSKILREYCKYSINDFNKKKLVLNLSEDVIKRKKDFKESIEKEKKLVETQIYDKLIKINGRTAGDFIKYLNILNDLNYINSNLEIKYSFKGWPGLFHQLIFEKAIQICQEEDIHKRQSNLEFKEVRKSKWSQLKI